MGVFLYILGVLVFLLSFLYLYFTWSFDYWKKRGVKNAKPQIFYGTTPSIFTQKRHVVYDYLDHYNEFKKTEKFIGSFSVRKPQLMVLSPDLAKQVYVGQFRKFQDNNLSEFFDSKRDPIFAKNPFVLTGQEWKDKRAEITPALTPSRVKASYPIMQKVSSKLIEFIKNKIQIEGKDYAFDCRELTERFTIQNVADCIYGVDALAFDCNKDSEFLKQARQLSKDLFGAAAVFFMLSVIPFATKLYRRKLMQPNVEKFFVNLMHDAIELRKQTKDVDRIDFLNYLMQLKEHKGLSDLELQALAITFFLDGFDTSATVIAHVILMLGRHKDVQQKLRQEIEKHLSKDGTINFEGLQDIQYLDQCINETIRMYPPGSVAEKVCTEDTEFTNSNGNVLQIKKGMSVILPVYCWHHDDEYYPNPEKFDPERFSPENGGDKKFRDKGVFYPFGDGPRICLGQRFALSQIKIAICELVRNFDITVSAKTRKDDLLEPTNIILYLKDGIWCNFKELKN